MSQIKPKKNLIFNPFSPDFQRNPYPTYSQLRSEEPIHWSCFSAWILTRYDDVEAILKDGRFQVDDLPLRLEEKSAYIKEGDLYPLAKTIPKWLFFLEAPNHTRLRGLVSKVFSAQNVEIMREEIEQRVNELLEKVITTGKIDLIQDLASPLSAMTISNILGLPPAEYHKLIPWSYDLSFLFNQPMSLEGYQRQNQVTMEVRDYLLDFMANLNNYPAQGLIHHLVKAKDEENKLSEDEIISFCVMLLVAGQKTTKGFISNAMLALLQHPEKLAELKNNPHIINNAVEELLRYDTPAQIILRIAKEDVQIRGKNIHKGDKVILCLGAANRDPEKFPQPDTIDFHRSNYNLPFGGGVHFCLGAFLARLQGGIALNALLQKLPNLQLATEELEWRTSITIRGLNILPLTFDKK